MYKLLNLFAIMLTASLATHICHAENLNPFLQEVSSFKILVENLPENLKEAGLLRTALEDRAEFFCRRNQLPIDDKSANTLYLQVSGIPLRKDGVVFGYTYNVTIRFYQNAKTLKDGRVHMVSSWTSSGTTGIAPGNTIHDEVRVAIRDEVESFANAWMASHTIKDNRENP